MAPRRLEQRLRLRLVRRTALTALPGPLRRLAPLALLLLLTAHGEAECFASRSLARFTGGVTLPAGSCACARHAGTSSGCVGAGRPRGEQTQRP